MATKAITRNTATGTKSIGFPPSGPLEITQVAKSTKHRNFVMEYLIDFANDPKLQTVANGGLGQVVTGDILQLLNVQDVIIDGIGMNVIEACDGTTPLAILGDGNDDNGWMTSTTLATAGPTISVGAYLAAGGKLYTTADTIDMTVTVTGTITKGKVLVIAYCRDCM